MGSRAAPTRQRKAPKTLQVINANPTNENIYYNSHNPHHHHHSGNRRRQQQISQIYNFNTDRSYQYLDVDLTPYVRDLTTRFVAWVVLTFIIELILLAWPIVATVMWSTWAALTWISFGYAIRLVALVATVVGVGSRVHRLAGRPVTLSKNPHRFVSVTLGTAFATSTPLKIWYVLAWAQGILTVLTLLLSLATAPYFSSHDKNLLLGLSLGFQILSIVQSLSWPGIFYAYGIRASLRSAVLSARRQKAQARYSQYQPQQQYPY